MLTMQIIGERAGDNASRIQRVQLMGSMKRSIKRGRTHHAPFFVRNMSLKDA
jgi:hypothetical protein